MKAARALRWARLTAGLSQRELAQRAGVPRSTVARIEAGLVDPRVGTLTQLLHACGYDMEVDERTWQGQDRSQVRARLDLPADERLRRIGPEAENLARLLESARRLAG